MIKTNLIKVFSILLISVLVISFASNVFAANNTGFTDLTDTVGSSGNQTGNNVGGNTNSNINKSNTNRNTNTNKISSSNYNNTDLPATGVESVIPVALLVVIFGISAVYAYKKIKDYNNI